MPKSKRGDNRADDLKWGEVKVTKTFMMTPTASELLDDAAEKLGATRSEAIEQLIRFGVAFAPNFSNPLSEPSRPSRQGKRISKAVSAMQALQKSLFPLEG